MRLIVAALMACACIAPTVFAQSVEEINKGIRERAAAEQKRQKSEGPRPPVELNIVVPRGMTGDGYTIDERENVKLRQRQEERQAEEIRRNGVSIGMTRQQASSSWGEPDKINSTTTARGTDEQWVYRSRFRGDQSRYLYFTNGVLKAIQN